MANNGAPDHNVQETIDKQKRIPLVMELRRDGFSYREIAVELERRHGIKVSYVTVWEDVKDGFALLRQTVIESAQDLVNAECERIDAALRAIWPKVKAGNFGAVDRYVKLAELRARLTGLNYSDRKELPGGATGVAVKAYVVFNPDTDV